MSERKTNTVWFHFYMESKSQKNKHNQIEIDSYIQRTHWFLPEVRWVRRVSEISEED